MNENVVKLVTKLKEEIEKRGIGAIRDFFSNENMLSNSLADKQDIEYIKRMITSQFYVYGMIRTHKYHDDYSNSALEQIQKDESRINDKIDSNNTLLFNQAELDALFGNPLNVQTEQEYNKLVNYYYNIYSNDTFNRMIDIEKDSKSLQLCKNPIKKMMLARRIKNKENHYTLGYPESKIVRTIVKDELLKNPNADQFEIYKRVSQRMDRGIYEAGQLFESKDLVKMALASLMISPKKIIDLGETAKLFRRELSDTYSLMDEKVEYRKKDTFLGGLRQKKTKNIDPSNIQEEMEKLQQEYEEAYNTSKDKEEYIRKITRIFAKFVYLQPFEDCNKRTGICLLNAMLESKGIKPIPFSVTHSKYLSFESVKHAYDRASEGEYESIEDVMIESYKRSGELANHSAEPVIEHSNVEKHAKINKIDGEIE